MLAKQSVISKGFPKRLKELRNERGWSQGQLAHKIGADLQRVSKYERGVICPTTEMMIKIANVFGVSLDYLLRDKKSLQVNQVSNEELSQRIEQLDWLSKEKQNALIPLLDAFITQQKFEELVQKKV